jgi:hypothetical protein
MLSRQDLQALILDLERARREVCPYPPPGCDCKFSLPGLSQPFGEALAVPAKPSSEATGCPELLAAISVLRRMSDRPESAPVIHQEPALTESERPGSQEILRVPRLRDGSRSCEVYRSPRVLPSPLPPGQTLASYNQWATTPCTDCQVGWEWHKNLGTGWIQRSNARLLRDWTLHPAYDRVSSPVEPEVGQYWVSLRGRRDQARVVEIAVIRDSAPGRQDLVLEEVSTGLLADRTVTWRNLCRGYVYAGSQGWWAEHPNLDVPLPQQPNPFLQTRKGPS